jgi:hypothetical protein
MLTVLTGNLEVAERGVAGAEVVDGQVYADRAQLPQHEQRRLRVVHEHAVGDLQPNARRRYAAARERLADERQQHRVAQLAGREVDRHVEVGPVGFSLRQRASCPSASPSTQRPRAG